MSGKRNTGLVELHISRLRANLNDEDTYHASIALNDEAQESLQFSPRRATRNPDWISEKESCLIVRPGTHTLRIQVYRHRTLRGPQQHGRASIELYRLIPGKTFRLTLDAGSSGWERSSPGTIDIRLSEISRLKNTERSYVHHTANNHVVMNSLHTSHQLLDELRQQNASLTSAWLDAAIVYLHSNLQFLASSPEVLVAPDPQHQNLLLDLIRQLSWQIDYFCNQYWPSVPNGDNTGQSLAKGFISLCGMSQVLVFSFVTWYQDATFVMISACSVECARAFTRFQNQLIALRAVMSGIYSYDINLENPDVKQDFFDHIARTSTDAYTGIAGELSGPHIALLECLQEQIAIEVMDAYKRLIDSFGAEPTRAGFRSTARRLMTRVARVAHRLPSELEIDAKAIEMPVTSHARGAIRSEIEGDNGSYADIKYGTLERRGGRVRVAVKTFHASATVERTYLEIIAGWTLSHPHILQTLGVTHGVDLGRLSLLTQRMEGGSVQDYINSPGFEQRHRDPAERYNLWLKQVADGLCYLHDEGVVHGDLHGRNILVNLDPDNADGHVVIADLGLCVFLNAASREFESTRSGNRRFLAPEISLGRGRGHNDGHRVFPGDNNAEYGVPLSLVSPSGRPTQQSDLFSFAMLCIQIYTKDIPFPESLDQGYAEHSIRHGKRPPCPPTLRNEILWRRIQICWQQNPSQRGDAYSLLQDLRKVAPGGNH